MQARNFNSRDKAILFWEKDTFKNFWYIWMGHKDQDQGKLGNGLYSCDSNIVLDFKGILQTK